MRRTLACLTACLLGLLTLTAVAGVEVAPAGAADAAARRTVWQSPYSTNEYDTKNATVQVASYADLSKRGFAVSLDVRFTCPRGERYRIQSDIQELTPLREPVFDGDNGIRAFQTKVPRGKCTGHRQVNTVHYEVRETHIDDGLAGCYDLWKWDPETRTVVNTGRQKCYQEGDYRWPIVATGRDQGRSSRMGEPYVRVAGRGFYAVYDAWEASCCGNAPNVGFR